MSPLDQFSRWLRLKQYQLEVTFSVYIFTSVEKFIFYSVLFLLFSLTFIATTLYLPRHIAFLISRAYFYVHGEGLDVVGLAEGAVSSLAKTAGMLGSSVVQDPVQGTAAVLREL